MQTNQVYAQFGEPDVQERETPRNLFDEGYKVGFGFNIALSDFGFGAGGQLRIGLDKYTEGIVDLKIKGLKDPTEQTFTDFLGYRTVPEKYQRVLAVPLYFGLKKRFFANAISDNFRAYTSLSAGPAFAFSYSYFNDINENGFRENDARIYPFTEPVNDVFTGWSNSETHWGFGGEFLVGVDFGDNFANLSSVQFGYTMNYFGSGIQVLEPCKPDLNRITQAPQNPCGVGPNEMADVVLSDGTISEAPLEQANDPRKYFGSAQISFVFGWMW
ncbi:MAG: hypothetical protein WD357_07130 [Gracilimonas sp.]